MKIEVQKYGGTSVGDLEKITKIAKYIRDCLHLVAAGEDKKIVVVVSAMNKTTNELIAQAHKLTLNPDLRELDQLLQIGETQTAALLAMKLIECGVKAKSLTAFQIGLTTNQSFGNAAILGLIDKEQVWSLLKQYDVLVATGFQGIAQYTVDKTVEITTVGRGGSDAVAVALAAELKANCVIFTDVDGVYAVDPRIVPNAKRFKTITPGQMIAMYKAGAGVMMGRSVEIAQKFGLPIKVQISPSFGKSDGGTKIYDPPTSNIESVPYSESIGLGIKPISMIHLNNVPNLPGVALKIFKGLGINLVEIMQIPAEEKHPTSLAMIIEDKDLSRALEALEQHLTKHKQLLSNVTIHCHKGLVALTLVDPKMADSSGYLERMLATLAKRTINVESIFSAEDKLGVVVKEEVHKKAAQALAEEFELTDEK